LKSGDICLENSLLLKYGFAVAQIWLCTSFRQTLKSPELLNLKFPDLESPEKGLGPGNPWKSHENLDVVVIEACHEKMCGLKQ